MRLWIQNHNDVTSNYQADVTLNYQTGVKWTPMTLVQCQNNRYKLGTHASFIFNDLSKGDYISSQMIKLTDMWLI